MHHWENVYREIAVPVSIFAALRKELGKEAGHLPTIHALHAAGYAAGSEASDAFRSYAEGDVSDLAESAFWARFAGFFNRRGWGSLSHSTEHHAVGILTSEDWAECGDGEGDEHTSCSFTAGFLSGLLTRLAEAPVAVLEVSCKGRSDGACSFAFGSESAIHELYGQLLDGEDLEGALASL
jgi:predicted hydrocarbon binding protein